MQYTLEEGWKICWSNAELMKIKMMTTVQITDNYYLFKCNKS